jgi:osmotically-inducible protein OsmY
MTLAMPMLVAQKVRSDDAIYDEVRRKLAADADVRGGALDIEIKSGVIVLKGFVKDEKARQKAAILTKKVKGVMSVDNQLKLLSDK